MADYPQSPASRIASILDIVLRAQPQFLLMQEVTMEMYNEIKQRLADWHVYKRHDQAEDYFNVTAVLWPAAAEDRCTSFLFPSSRNGRHTLAVRRGQWLVVNVHAESGSGAVDRDARSDQLRYMSRSHEREAQQLHILCGDMNARPGEDQCLLTEGWRDAWSAAGSAVDWTWRGHGQTARYDRAYIHNSAEASARCVKIERLCDVCGALSDHVPLHVVVKTRARAALAKDPDRTSDMVGRIQLKQDVQVTAIANAVERGVAHFQQVVELCGASTRRCT